MFGTWPSCSPDLSLVESTEAALSSLEFIQKKLRDDQQALQEDINLLRDELHQHQDPERMQCIQELISVRCFHKQCNLFQVEIRLIV